MEQTAKNGETWKQIAKWSLATVTAGALAVGVRHLTVDSTRSNFDHDTRVWLAEHNIPACTPNETIDGAEIPCLKQFEASTETGVVATDRGDVNIYCDMSDTDSPSGCYVIQSDGYQDRITGPDSVKNPSS